MAYTHTKNRAENVIVGTKEDVHNLEKLMMGYNGKKKPVLVFDDETLPLISVVRGLSHLFGQQAHCEDYLIVGVHNNQIGLVPAVLSAANMSSQPFVLSDIDMRCMCGQDVLEAVHKRYPSCVNCFAYTASDITLDSSVARVTLRKPIDVNDLKTLVDLSLGAGSSQDDGYLS